MRTRDERRRDRATLAYAFVLALVFHWVVVAAIPQFHDTPIPVTELKSEFVEVVEPEAPPPEPVAPEPEPEPEPVRPTPVVHQARAPEPMREPPPPAAAPPPAAPPETPVDFGGETLSNENSTWTQQAASGAPRGDLIGRPGAHVTGRSQEGVAGGTPGGTGTGPVLVAAADLRRRPRLPSGDTLNGLLQRNYPEEAKRQGISGHAEVLMVLDADGHPQRPRVLRETPPGQGFGAACRRTLLASPAWEPALGPDGRPAATQIPFTCDFDVNQ